MTSLIVLAKQPLPGRVKTRLAPPLSLEQAAGLAAAALRDTLAAAQSTDVDEYLLAFDGDATEWLPPGWRSAQQPTGGLDRRLVAAFGAVDQDQASVLIGMDTPQFQPRQVEAFDPIEYDACLGLATDGGFWAIGLRDPRRAAEVILGVPMSTADTGMIQFERLRCAGLRVQLLDDLTDVDTYAAALVVAGAAPDGEFARALRELHVVHA